MHVKNLRVILLMAAAFLWVCPANPTVWAQSGTRLDRNLSDAEFSTACGPIACFVAAYKSGGYEGTLDAVAKECNWQEGRRTSLAEMCDAIRRVSNKIECRPCLLSPDQLFSFLGENPQASAVLAVRTGQGEIDHAVCAAGVKKDSFVIIDYPRVTYLLHMDQVYDVWDGHALLVEPKSMSPLKFLALGVVPGALVAIVAIVALGVWRFASDFHWFRKSVVPFVLITALLSCCTAGRPSFAQEVLWGMSLSKDGGLVDPGDSVEYTFKVRNNHEHPIKMGRWRTSCSCLSVASAPQELPAQAVSSIRVRLTPGLRRGLVSDSIVFSTEHPRVKYVRLTISAVAQGIWAEPRQFELGSLEQVEAARSEVSVVIFGAGLPEVRITSAAVPLAGLNISQHNVETGDKSKGREVRALKQLKIEVDPTKMAVGPFATSVIVETNNAKCSELLIPVRGNVVGRVQLSPSRILFGVLKSAAVVERKCKIVLDEAQVTERPIESMTLVTDTKGVEASIVEVRRENGTTIVTMKLRARADDFGDVQNFSGCILGRDGDRDVFSVPFVGLVLHE